MKCLPLYRVRRLLPRLAIPAFIGECDRHGAAGTHVRFIDFFFMRFAEKTFPCHVKPEENLGESRIAASPLRENSPSR